MLIRWLIRLIKKELREELQMSATQDQVNELAAQIITAAQVISSLPPRVELDLNPLAIAVRDLVIAVNTLATPPVV